MAEAEYWLRGPIDRIEPLLQPVAHSLFQAREDVAAALSHMPPDQLWIRPHGAASIGFHVKHLCGSLDRLFSYARGEALTAAQLAYLQSENDAGSPPADAAALIALVHDAVERALVQLRTTSVAALTDARAVGRQRLPSTVIGLLVHAAEHTTRHAGQIITTAKIVAKIVTA
jgi:uncharacterized damage-inducible protein DinB